MCRMIDHYSEDEFSSDDSSEEEAQETIEQTKTINYLNKTITEQDTRELDAYDF